PPQLGLPVPAATELRVRLGLLGPRADSGFTLLAERTARPCRRRAAIAGLGRQHRVQARLTDLRRLRLLRPAPGHRHERHAPGMASRTGIAAAALCSHGRSIIPDRMGVRPVGAGFQRTPLGAGAGKRPYRLTQNSTKRRRGAAVSLRETLSPPELSRRLPTPI